MEFDPARAHRTAADLDALADRLEADLRTNAPALSVPAPGADEVSQRAAATLRDVASSYGVSADAGVLELRKLAAGLRSQSRQLTTMDADNAADVGSTV